jgi:hypothetical protein
LGTSWRGPMMIKGKNKEATEYMVEDLISHGETKD